MNRRLCDAVILLISPNKVQFERYSSGEFDLRDAGLQRLEKNA
jgi:hypothetical protein